MSTEKSRYFIIVFLSLIAVFFTKQWLNSVRHNSVKPELPRKEYKFDAANYVDPYGSTTCYPSDHKRLSSKRKSKGNSKTGKYHYRITLGNVHREWESFEQETLADGRLRLKRDDKDLSYLAGTYEWDMDLYIPEKDDILTYILEHYDELKKFKTNKGVNNIYDEFNDNIDNYLDDPEDEITYVPDIYDFLKD